MIYANNQEAMADFWTKKIGFVKKSENDKNAVERWIEIAPTKESETIFVLQDKVAVAKAQPQMNLGTPSILFFCENIDEIYKEYKEKGITVGDLVNVPNFGRVFNFSDIESNYFAILEK